VAAHTTLSIIADERLLDNAVRIGDLIRSGLRERLGVRTQIKTFEAKG
jgi:4-aminobutyrate aminotransferase-like enzyme